MLNRDETASYTSVATLLQYMMEACQDIKGCVLDAREEFAELNWAPIISQLDALESAVETFEIPSEDLEEEGEEFDPLPTAIYKAVSDVIKAVTGHKRAFNFTLELLPDQLN